MVNNKGATRPKICPLQQQKVVCFVHWTDMWIIIIIMKWWSYASFPICTVLQNCLFLFIFNEIPLLGRTKFCKKTWNSTEKSCLWIFTYKFKILMDSIHFTILEHNVILHIRNLYRKIIFNVSWFHYGLFWNNVTMTNSKTYVKVCKDKENQSIIEQIFWERKKWEIMLVKQLKIL